MSADFNTEILMKGTKEELMAMTKVLKSYVTEKQNQYILTGMFCITRSMKVIEIVRRIDDLAKVKLQMEAVFDIASIFIWKK